MTDAFFNQELDAKWLTSRLDGRTVSHFSFDSLDLEKLNKTSGLRYSIINFTDGGAIRLVFKMSSPSSPISVIHGLAREALFYQNWKTIPTATCHRCDLDPVLPRVYHAHGNMDTGEKLILMEDLQSDESGGCVQLGYLFDAIGNWPGNPNNWGKVNITLTLTLTLTLALTLTLTLKGPFRDRELPFSPNRRQGGHDSRLLGSG
jgi:hypothetical protein